MSPSRASTSQQPDAPGGAVRFGAFMLVPDEQRLARGEVDVPLGARAFDVLRVLAERPGRLVTKDELLARVWRGLVVEESNLQVQVSQIRKAIGADAIATVPGLGYRFVAHVDPVPADGAAAAPGVGAAPDRALSVLVLPFVESSAPADEAWYADAITDDVIARLSRIRGATVIATPTSLAFKGEAIDWAAAARGLGVRYVLHGRIERDAEGIEVTARLSDAATRAVVWSDCIEVAHAALRRIRHELVARLCAALGLELLQAEARRLGAHGEGSPDANALVMRGRAAGGSNWASRAHYVESLAMFERALAIEPDHAEALAEHALALAVQPYAWPGPDIAAQIARAEAGALRALALDSLNPVAYYALSVVRQQQYRIDEAMVAIESAIALDPNGVGLVAWRGELLKFRCDTDGARAAVLRALELSPRDPHRWVLFNRMGTIEIVAGNAAAAVPWYERSIALHPYWLTRTFLMAAYAATGGGDRLRELKAQSAAGAAEQTVYNTWNRVTDDPEFLRRMRDHLFAPLVACGVLPHMGIAEAWIARQRRRG
jgi:TolB-like protein